MHIGQKRSPTLANDGGATARNGDGYLLRSVAAGSLLFSQLSSLPKSLTLVEVGDSQTSKDVGTRILRLRTRGTETDTCRSFTLSPRVGLSKS